MESEIEINSSYFDFKLLKKEYNSEIGAEVFQFHHQSTNASLFAIKNNDSNKTFVVSFKTIPNNSNGVAHVLEHTVLSGSRKFQVKDVFNEISKGGLTTFLNAMTFPDMTMYPFATRNLKEYFNIMDIYLDTTFYPKIDEFAFLQEGWRYHIENFKDEIKIKGVVYNEMKGVYSNPTSQAWYTLFEHLMPESTYSHVSGGNPKNIPDLTWNELKEFHSKFYHPTNATFFVYGDAPLNQELEFLNKNYLSNFSKKINIEPINFGKKNKSFKKIHTTYAVNKNESKSNKTFLILGIPVTTSENDEEILALKILSEILFSSDASPLKIDFFESKIGKDIEGGLLSQNHTAVLFIEVIGSEINKMDEFLRIFNTSLRKIINNGLDSELILSELNNYEFHKREESCNSQRGLQYVLKLTNAKKLNKSPFNALKSDKIFKSIRKKILKDNYLEYLIEDKLLNLEKSVAVTLSPEQGKNEKENENLKAKLSNFKSSLTKNQINNLINKTHEFEKYQNLENSEKNLEILPSININDIPKELDYKAADIINGKNNSTTILNDIYTGGISYYNFGFDCSIIPKNLLIYLDIFGMIITEIGTKKLDYIEFSKKKNIYTGNISYQFSIFNHVENRDDYKSIFWINAKILKEYISEGLKLIEDLIFEHNFENTHRIKEIIERNYAWIENQVQSEGYQLPLSRSKAKLHESCYIKELVSGSMGFLHLKKLISNYDKMENELISSLIKIGELLFNQQNSIFTITAERNDIIYAKPIINKIFQNLSSEKLPKQKITMDTNFGNDALITSAEIVFAVQTGEIFKSGKDFNGSFEVLRSYLGNEYLHEKVRAQGGAYGCFPIFDSNTGILSFVSYRDPNVKSTYEAYNNIPQAVKDIELSERALEQLIIRTFGNFDPLLNPYMQGIISRNRYLTGKTKEFLFKILSEIKSTNIKDLQGYFYPIQDFSINAVRSIIGNKDKIQSNKNLFDTLIQL
ncbi:MAG: peptidase M16 [Candidatus Marinimicrobia bacterium]|nr:peptidase M16 [Candidatus Neomarinimicrobiota bacterium]